MSAQRLAEKLIASKQVRTDGAIQPGFHQRDAYASVIKPTLQDRPGQGFSIQAGLLFQEREARSRTCASVFTAVAGC